MGSAAEQDLLEEKIQAVRRRDRRFSRHAYYFVLDALDYTMAGLGRDQLTGEDRHVGGRELLAGHLAHSRRPDDRAAALSPCSRRHRR